MEQSPLWEATYRLSNKEIALFFWKPTFRYRLHVVKQDSTLVHLLRVGFFKTVSVTTEPLKWNTAIIKPKKLY